MASILNIKVRAGDLFNSLGGEEENQLSREIEVKGNPRLEAIVKGFEKVLLDNSDSIDIKEIYSLCLSLSPQEPISRDITLFSMSLRKYEDDNSFSEYAGLYFSALINKSKDKEFNLNLQILSFALDYLGYENTKLIHVNGDVEDCVGSRMENGEIHVNGNAGDFVGDMMQNGKIYVSGNVGDRVGLYMKNGEIYISRDYEKLSNNISGGNIYHKGKQIIRDGESVPGEVVKWAD